MNKILLILPLLSTAKAFLAPSAKGLSKIAPLEATWSNGQAIREYQDFLASGKQEIEKEEDTASVIVKSVHHASLSNTVGDAITSMNPKKNDVLLFPTEPLPPTLDGKESYPIYVTIPPTELELFIKTLPDDWKAKREDFVFLSGGPQCGCIEPILKDYGYARDSMTQLLCGSFTTPDTNIGKPRDLSCNIGSDSYGEVKTAGETAVCGKWAGAVEQRFTEAGIKCKSGFYREWRRLMWERAAFDAVFNLIGAVREEPTTLKDVATYYEQEASDMLWQVTSNLRGWLAVTVAYGFEERLFSFAEMRCGDIPCQISEEMFPYVFCAPLDKGNMLIEYLNYAQQERGLIPNIPLPKCDTRPSLMRQGNLRADGAV